MRKRNVRDERLTCWANLSVISLSPDTPFQLSFHLNLRPVKSLIYEVDSEKAEAHPLLLVVFESTGFAERDGERDDLGMMK